MSPVLPLLLSGLVAGAALAQEPTPAPPAAPSAAPSPAAAPTPAPARGTLSDVAWIRGHWREDGTGTISEEIWSAPEGNSMIGMWRYVAMGEARVFELLTLTQEEGTVMLRLRHFDPKLVAWAAEKEHPLSLALVRVGQGEAAFEGRDSGGKMVRITYGRIGDEGLTIRLEREGKPTQSFRFKHVGPR